MSAISPRVMRDRKLEAFVTIVRSGEHHEAHHPSGYIICTHCGGPALSQSDLAREIGVSPRDVSNFLNRRPVREDAARRIRNSVKQVLE